MGSQLFHEEGNTRKSHVVLGLSMILSDGAASVPVTSLVPGWPSADLVVGRLVVPANCGEGEQQRPSQSRY